MALRRLFYLAFLLTFLASLIGPVSGSRAQTQTPPQVLTLLRSMTPEERVGQLFLVTFRGTDTGVQSPIHDLIANQHVGGVILLAENDNFVAEPDTIPSTHQLIANLQNIEANAQPSDANRRQPYVPLFVGIMQEGDGNPNDQILGGMTPLPNEMAIGATWKTENAQQVGFVLGSELSAIGFNMFMGPSLDVVEAPNPSARSDLGTRVFGGDPFWAGKMGQAYISGLHEGGNGRMMVVAKHFPGRGGSDRSPEEEVATVRKSLEQLKQVELSPFFSVTNSTDVQAITDGLLVSHIRYQGFQGNIRATTRPVSFDSSALSAILALPEFSAWRGNGGLIVSDDLGSKAVRAFYTLGGENFSPRQVARDAFIAGNDLLYLGNISSEDEDTYSTTLRIVNSFSQEYRNDPIFAQSVDAAVVRILTHKLNMYPDLNVDSVIGPASRLANIGSSGQVAFDIARNAATLISPDSQELNTLLPAAPNTNERIVFISDVSQHKQCSSCPVYDAFAVDSLEKSVLRLYGPTGSGQIYKNRLSSFPLSEFGLLLDGTTQTDIESALSNASWIVLSLTDVGNGQINLLRRFFSERPNLIRNKNIILFSFTAPYYLDATDISKLTAYYALYSKQPAFMDAAARILFQQIALQGSSPVSIPAVGYDLIVQMSPDPAQIIPLQLEVTNPSVTETADVLTPVPIQIPSYKIGDKILVLAGPLLDHNSHIVPDGTVARFTMSTRDESGNILQQVDVITTDGMARASFVIDKPGKVEVKVISEPALVSQVLQFDATGEGIAVTVEVPSITETPQEIVAAPTPEVENNFISTGGYPLPGMWILVAMSVIGSAVLVYWTVGRVVVPRWGMRFGLCALIGGFGAYNYLALGFPRALEWTLSESGGAFGVLLFTLAGEATGIILAWVWWRWFSGSESKAD